MSIETASDCGTSRRAANIVVSADGLGKRYRVAKARQRDDTLRDQIDVSLRSAAYGVRRLLAPGSVDPSEDPATTIWALRDANFEVERGEVVGIIGRNGAGKSTLLKLLARITEPSEGRALIQGRVGSLLEVGTGFHPELSGRENILLNGAILGMRRTEIIDRFEEIVEFSGVGEFLEMPVKRYSSGMRMRLAFSVAAHLETDVLLIDEVLAVGDIAFQSKCMGKMEDVSRAGRTVLFVSHNMASISNLCPRTMYVDGGRIVRDGDTGDVLTQYIADAGLRAATDLDRREDRQGDQSIRFSALELVNGLGEVVSQIISGEDATFRLHLVLDEPLPKNAVYVGLSIRGRHDEKLIEMATEYTGFTGPAELQHSSVVECRVPRLPLAPGRYYINLYSAAQGSVADWVAHAHVLDVVEGDFFGSGRLPPDHGGRILVPHAWHLLG